MTPYYFNGRLMYYISVFIFSFVPATLLRALYATSIVMHVPHVHNEKQSQHVYLMQFPQVTSRASLARFADMYPCKGKLIAGVTHIDIIQHAQPSNDEGHNLLLAV